MPLERLYFNSIKVRLRQLLISRGEVRVLFQFHKGSIKTIYLSEDGRLTFEFQFHKGSIKTGILNDEEAKKNTISIP